MSQKSKNKYAFKNSLYTIHLMYTHTLIRSDSMAIIYYPAARAFAKRRHLCKNLMT